MGGYPGRLETALVLGRYDAVCFAGSQNLLRSRGWFRCPLGVSSFTLLLALPPRALKLEACARSPSRRGSPLTIRRLRRTIGDGLPAPPSRIRIQNEPSQPIWTINLARYGLECAESRQSSKCGARKEEQLDCRLSTVRRCACSIKVSQRGWTAIAGVCFAAIRNTC